MNIYQSIRKSACLLSTLCCNYHDHSF